MPSPELNLNSFDLVDLWQQTDTIAAGLKEGVYVSEFWAPGDEVNASLGWDVTDRPQRLRLENAKITLNSNESSTFIKQVRSAMGAPRYSPMPNGELKTHDDAPELSPLPDVQLAVAQTFLTKISRIALNSTVVGGTEHPLLIANRGGESTRNNILQLARINLGIATLLGYETDKYKDVVKRAEVWSPQSMKKLNWL